MVPGREELLLKREVWRPEQEAPRTDRTGQLVRRLEETAAQMPLPKRKEDTDLGLRGVQPRMSGPVRN